MGRQEPPEALLNKEKRKALPPGRENPMHQDLLEATQLGSSFAGKNLGGPGGHQVDHKAAVCPCAQHW